MALRETVLRKGTLLPPHPSSESSSRLHPIGKDVSPLSWETFFDEKKTFKINDDSFNVYIKGYTGPLFLLLHGGGYSGLTWSCFVSELCARIDCRIICPDLRGHGDSHTTDDGNLSREQQMQDISAILKVACADDYSAGVCVIGHSMGGALGVHVVRANLIPNVMGLVVVDVVEGTAMEALGHMQSFLHNRPDSFVSIESAIKWCMKSGTVKNLQAARISMPSQIIKKSDATFGWRIDLSKTACFWPAWFQGLSSSFLSCSPPKLLVLAGVDRLDKELMIGQMQGKFQTTVLPRAGHAVQEDSPDQLAEEVARFATRYRFAERKADAPCIEQRQPLKLGQMI